MTTIAIILQHNSNNFSIKKKKYLSLTNVFWVVSHELVSECGVT